MTLKICVCVVLDVIYMKLDILCQVAIYWLLELSTVLFLEFKFIRSNSNLFKWFT